MSAAPAIATAQSPSGTSPGIPKATSFSPRLAPGRCSNRQAALEPHLLERSSMTPHGATLWRSASRPIAPTTEDACWQFA